ncbi:MAG: NAD-dependent epimerase/dehydratase family protein [Puniceicoccaceae bacterium]
MRILITGASGFVGNRLTKALLDAGHEVIGADLVPPESVDNGQGTFQFVEVDLTDPDSVASLPLGDVDLLYHLAAAGVKASSRDWPLCVRVNVLGTLHLKNTLEELALKLSKVPRIVYSKSYYEDHLLHVPAFMDNPYVVTKQAATDIVEQLAKSYPESVRIAKVYQVFGPDDDAGSVLSYAAKTLLAGETATFGNGEGQRDWIYIEDFIDGLIQCGLSEGEGLLRYDLGNKTAVSLKDLVKQLAVICGRPESALVFDPSIDRGDGALCDSASNWPPDWEPKWPMQKALEDLVEGISRKDHLK